jgi:hypothetical protein
VGTNFAVIKDTRTESLWPAGGLSRADRAAQVRPTSPGTLGHCLLSCVTCWKPPLGPASGFSDARQSCTQIGAICTAGHGVPATRSKGARCGVLGEERLGFVLRVNQAEPGAPRLGRDRAEVTGAARRVGRRA